MSETPSGVSAHESQGAAKGKLKDRITARREFKDRFRESTKKVYVDALKREVRMVDFSPTIDSEKSHVPLVVVPGWTEDEKVLKPSIRALTDIGYHVLSFTPGRLINPNRSDYPEGLQDAINKLSELQDEGEAGKVILTNLMKHPRYQYNVQKAVELLAVINTLPPGQKVDLGGKSQGLIVATIAALLEPDRVRNIVGMGGAGTIDEDKQINLMGRFVGKHLPGSSIRAVTRPKDFWRITRGGIGAAKYIGRNPIQSVFRESGAIAKSKVYDPLDYLREKYGILSELIPYDRDRLFPLHRVEAAHSEFSERTGHVIPLHPTPGMHNEPYIRPVEQMQIVDTHLTSMASRRAA